MYLRGDEIIRCDPFSYVVKSSILPNVCDFCLQTTFENAGKSFTVKKCTGKILANTTIFKCSQNFTKLLVQNMKECKKIISGFRVQKNLLLQ